MRIAIIVAHSQNLVIGRDGGLPWHYPEDLKHFKSRTMGCPVVMGRGVFEELNQKPLPGRENIVLTKTRSYDNVTVFSEIDNALASLHQHEKIYIIGGGEIYRQTMHLVDRLEITEIEKDVEGDVYFPEYRNDIGTIWKEVLREKHEEFDFVDYERIR